LSGEVRAVSRIEQRISEAEKLGFERIFVSGFSQKNTSSAKQKIEIVPIQKIHELVKWIA
jgi:DNA repair protein RadA/Sms